MLFTIGLAFVLGLLFGFGIGICAADYRPFKTKTTC